MCSSNSSVTHHKIIHSWSHARAAFSSFSVCPLNQSCSHFTNRPKNTISWAHTNPQTLLISPHSHKSSISHHHSPSRQHALPLSVSIKEVRLPCFLVARIFIFPVVFVYVFDNMRTLNGLTPGAVHIYPWRHTGGLSVWRNSHTSLRVQSRFLRADPHRLADQLVPPEGWIPGNWLAERILRHSHLCKFESNLNQIFSLPFPLCPDIKFGDSSASAWRLQYCFVA